MKSRSYFQCLAVALLMGAAAQAAPVGTAILHNGQLTENGAPANGIYDLQFRLFDGYSGGNQFGPPLTYEDLVISNGVFQLYLDFGAMAFTGDERWLEVAARPGTSTDEFQLLAGRQRMDPVPYAIYAATADIAAMALKASNAVSAANADTATTVLWSGLQNAPAGFADGIDNDTTYTAGAGLTLNRTQFNVNFGNSGSQDVAARADHEHFGEVWTGSLFAPGLVSRNTASNGSGVAGRQGANPVWSQPVTAGLFGDSWDGDGILGVSRNSRGLFGRTVETNGVNFGVMGFSPSKFGYGVYGTVSAKSGTTYGVAGVVDSTSGVGVQGWATATSGFAFGVHGKSASANGRGVYGESTATEGSPSGVYGRSDSPDGRGVYGVAMTTTGQNIGVYGRSESSIGRGVLGYAAANSGVNHGVHGKTDSTNGIGVYATGPKVAIKADGGGVIQSSAESFVFVPGAMLARGSGIGADKFHTKTLPGGGLHIGTLAVPNWCTVTIPVPLPSVLYGQAVTIKDVTIYTARNGTNYVSGTTISLGDGTGNVQELHADDLDRTGPGQHIYTIPLNKTMTAGQGFLDVQLLLNFKTADEQYFGQGVFIRGVKVRLGHQ
jgi:hypothetical protein